MIFHSPNNYRAGEWAVQRVHAMSNVTDWLVTLYGVLVLCPTLRTTRTFVQARAVVDDFGNLILVEALS